MKAQYFLLHGKSNVIRVMDDVEYCYLDHSTGKWVPRNSLFNAVTGAGGDADTHEISLQEAKQWVTKKLPDLFIEWL